MRRLLGDPRGAVYHCVTRTVNGEVFFEKKDLWVLRAMLGRVAGFCGVEVVSYALMGNHMHLLVRVSESAKEVGDDELLRRYRLLYPKPTKYQTAEIGVMALELERNSEEGGRIRERLKARMGDLAAFMKTLKQRFSIYYNQNHGRFGTLWAERYQSTLIEDDANVLRTVAAYIDLNPIRAGLVDDPKDYLFCSYADAVGGSVHYRSQIRALFVGTSGERRYMAAYRECLYRWGQAPKRDGSGARLQPEVVQREMERGGVLSAGEQLAVRVRYLSRGLVVGSRAFIESCQQQFEAYLPRKQKRTPSPTGVETDVGLFALRRCRSRRE